MYFSDCISHVNYIIYIFLYFQFPQQLVPDEGLESELEFCSEYHLPYHNVPPSAIFSPYALMDPSFPVSSRVTSSKLFTVFLGNISSVLMKNVRIGVTVNSYTSKNIDFLPDKKI